MLYFLFTNNPIPKPTTSKAAANPLVKVQSVTFSVTVDVDSDMETAVVE
ncbi:MAG: hypothetical protein QXZ41_05645 [Ignisphaera sp.]